MSDSKKLEKKLEELLKKKGYSGSSLSKAMGIANQETQGFTRLKENLNYSPEKIKKIFKRLFRKDKDFVGPIPNPEFYSVKGKSGEEREIAKNSLARDAYGNFIGRGIFQHSGKPQYEEIKKETGIDVIKNPELLEDPEVALKVAEWYVEKKLKPEREFKKIMKTQNRNDPRMKQKQDLIDKYMKKYDTEAKGKYLFGSGEDNDLIEKNTMKKEDKLNKIQKILEDKQKLSGDNPFGRPEGSSYAYGGFKLEPEQEEDYSDTYDKQSQLLDNILEQQKQDQEPEEERNVLQEGLDNMLQRKGLPVGDVDIPEKREESEFEPDLEPPFKSVGDQLLAKEETDNSNDITQTRETGEPSALEMADEKREEVMDREQESFPVAKSETPVGDIRELDRGIFSPEEPQEDKIESFLARIARMKQAERDKTGKEFEGKETKARIMDSIMALAQGLDKAGGFWSAANPNARLSPMQTGMKLKTDRLKELLSQKSELQKAREKSIEDIMQPMKVGKKLVQYNPETGKYDTLIEDDGDQKLTAYQQAMLDESRLNREQRNEISQLNRIIRESKDDRQKDMAKTKLDLLIGDKFKGVRQAFESNATVKALKGQNLSFDQVESLLDQMKKDNKVALGALGTKMARAMGEVGVLTDTDVVRYITSQGISRKVKDYFTTKTAGKISNPTQKDLEDIANIMKISANKNLNQVKREYLDIAHENYSKALGMTYEDTKKRLGWYGGEGKDSKSPSSEYTSSQEKGIQRVMENNNISRKEAIKALKDAGKL